MRMQLCRAGRARPGQWWRHLASQSRLIDVRGQVRASERSKTLVNCWRLVIPVYTSVDQSVTLQVYVLRGSTRELSVLRSCVSVYGRYAKLADLSNLWNCSPRKLQKIREKISRSKCYHKKLPSASWPFSPRIGLSANRRSILKRISRAWGPFSMQILQHACMFLRSTHLEL